MLPIVKAYPQIETCMECSAKKLQYVGEVFYYALKSGEPVSRVEPVQPEKLCLVRV